MSSDNNEGVVGCFSRIALLLLALPIFIPIGPNLVIVLITLSLIAIIYAFIESISKRIKSSNRRRETVLNEKQRKLNFRESVNLSGGGKAITNKIVNQVEITGSTKESNITSKNQNNRKKTSNSKKVICNKCGALFEDNSLICSYCGSVLDLW